MKHIVLCLLIFFLASCSIKNDYYNTRLQSIRFPIEFYKPLSYKLVKEDTLKYDYARNLTYKYQNSQDTNITITIQYTQQQLRTYDCNLKCMLDNFLLDLDMLKDKSSIYSYISAINGKDFARVHYNIIEYKYVCDEIFAKYKGIRVIARITSWNYNATDTLKYTSIRDSLFNSIHLDRR